MVYIVQLNPVQRNFLLCILFLTGVNILFGLAYFSVWSDNKAKSFNSGAPVEYTQKNMSTVLLVSALFFLPSTPREATDTHIKWLRHFLGSITTDIYFYTTPELRYTVEAMRGNLPITIDTSFRSPFDIPPLMKRENVYLKMVPQDDEEGTINRRVRLYGARNAKPYLIEHAIWATQKREAYDYVFWSDVGGFKADHRYRLWPDPLRVRQVWDEGSRSAGRPRNDLVFIPTIDPPTKQTRTWTEDMGPIYHNFTQSLFFGGSMDAMLWFSKTFYSYHDHFLRLGLFVGHADSIVNSIVVLFPSRFISVWARDSAAPAHRGQPPGFLGYGFLGACGHDDYYYQWWLSDEQTREEVKSHWMHVMLPERTHHWWKLKFPCQVTRTLGMEELLKRNFGHSWVPPLSTVTNPSRTW